ncbi:uncharacterized protein rbm33b isoform X2 [Triplophysa dalaica]|uniref:uncharacterized protein rbm33b isoform X2 n=1 Tax=Triplophysa dalaica TaxID=1582913 RepID=UPI0024DF8955|nr:uncharacterized protein rbm33b isoform X2 [Triplophysa dalaica]
MNSDLEEDMMVDDWLTAKQDLFDTSDEELNDDLLCSDDENETMRTSHLAKDQATCAEEERTEIEVDPDEVLDIEINAPSGDEFQSGAELRGGLCSPHMHSSCREQPAPKKTFTRTCCSPETRFPGQHMLDQQHPASVLDTNPLLAGQTPKGFLLPPGRESDPRRPSPALQGPMSPSKSGRPKPTQDPLRNYPSPRTVPHFPDPSGSRARKPAVLVRAVARMGSSAKPMAVARGIPIATKQPASAKSTISAKTPPAQGTVGRNAGQKVKEEPQTPPAPQKLPMKPQNNEGCGDDSELYRQRLMEQIQLRKEILEHKERRRRKQALKKKRRLKKRHRRGSNRCKKNNQQKPTLCSVLNCHSECQPVPQEHQYHHLVATPHAYSGRAKEMPFYCPHQVGTDRVVFPGHRNLHCSTALASQAWEVRKRKLELGDSDTSVPIKIRVVKHFNTSDRQESTSSNLRRQMSEEFRNVIETEPRIVILTTLDSFQQHSPRLLCPNHSRVAIPNQSQHKVPVGENQGCAFIPFSSGLRTESVAAQSNVNFIVRLDQ